jgi:hypothetical protein
VALEVNLEACREQVGVLDRRPGGRGMQETLFAVVGHLARVVEIQRRRFRSRRDGYGGGLHRRLLRPHHGSG